jgi:hypothetical protein
MPWECLPTMIVTRMEKGTEIPNDWDLELPNQPPFPIPRAATSNAPTAATSKALTAAMSMAPTAATSKVPTAATSKALAAAKSAAASKEHQQEVSRLPYRRILARKSAGGPAPKQKARTSPTKKQLSQRNLPTQASNPAKAAAKPWGNVQ